MGKHIISANSNTDVNLIGSDTIPQAMPVIESLAERAPAPTDRSSIAYDKWLLGMAACLLLVAGALFMFGEKLASFEMLKPFFGLACIAGAFAALAFISKHYYGSKAKKDGKAAFSSSNVGHDGNRFSLVPVSLTDEQTGLGNKKRLSEKFENLSKKSMDENKPFCVGLVNLDGMKPINDLYGKAGGDDLIKQCAMRLRVAIGNHGFVYRHEGDQFAFVLPDSGAKKDVLKIGTLLQDVLLAPFDIENTSVRVGGSFGFAIFPDAGTNFDTLMTNIETALYHSKQNGRGRITVYSTEVENNVRENAVMEQALRRAISENQINPHYQPIISLQDGVLLGFEALARWIDPVLGFVSPAKFIPLAEERGIIAQLTETLLLQAARTAADWPEDMFLSFNLSSVQLVDPSTAESILDIIKRAGLPANRLEIEVTETAIMSDPEVAAKIIEELHNANVRISMDDFGTGQSSLGRLRELKLDKVKIDRAFIMAIGEDKPAEHIVRAILEMCAGLDLTVVAEGIEEVGQAESLKKFGCHAGQGYLFGKAQDAIRTMNYIHEFRKVAQSDRELKIA